MKKQIINYLIAIQTLMACCVFESIAFNDLEAGTYLWKLINEARSRPLQTMQAYGIDYDMAKCALGEDVWILELENGLPPLAWNSTLGDTSSAHNNDMINRQFYSYTSPEGVSFHDRINNSGYNPILTGETLSILSFYLYVDPVKAVEGIFENMLRDELNPDLGYPKNIFSKDFTEIGISFISTVFTISTEPSEKESILNAYLVTADFAKPVEKRSYILGNIYIIGEKQPDKIESNENLILENNYAEKLLGYKSWSPEKSYNDFILLVQNFTERWKVEAVRGPLGSYQIQMPANTFYSIELFSKQQNSEANLNLLKRIVNISVNTNKMVDFGINEVQ